MAIIDRTQLDRQWAIVDIIKESHGLIGWHAISELPIEVQNDLYERLHATEAQAS